MLRHALQRAAMLAERMEDPELLTRAGRLLATWLETSGGDEDEVRRIVDRALEMVGERDPDARATLLACRAKMRWELPGAEREAMLHEADALAARHETSEVLLHVALCRASLHDPTRVEESRAAIANGALRRSVHSVLRCGDSPDPWRS